PQGTVSAWLPRKEPAELTNSTGQAPLAGAGPWHWPGPGERDTTVAARPHTRTSVTDSTLQFPVAVTTSPGDAVVGESWSSHAHVPPQQRPKMFRSACTASDTKLPIRMLLWPSEMSDWGAHTSAATTPPRPKETF